MARSFPGTVIGAGLTTEGKPFALYLLTDLAAGEQQSRLVPSLEDRRVRVYSAGEEAYAAMAWEGGYLVGSNGAHTDKRPNGRPGGLLERRENISAILLHWGVVTGNPTTRIGLRLGVDPPQDAPGGEGELERKYVAHFGITSPEYTVAPFLPLIRGEAFTGPTFSGRRDRPRVPDREAWLHQQPMDGLTAEELIEEQIALVDGDIFLGAAAALYDGGWTIAVRNRHSPREHA